MMLKITILTLGMALIIAGTIMFTYTFFKAYANEEKMLTITINQHGEADIEMFMVVLTLIFIPFIAFDFFWMHKKELEAYYKKKYENGMCGT